MRTARPEPSGFAAKAKDLQALRDAVVEAATVSGALWISYIFVFLYLAIAAGAVTHKDLFFENPVKLPFLNVELPLIAFFTLGPALFLIVHAYTLLHFAMLAGKVGAFHAELEAQIRPEDTRARLRRQLPSNIFVQFLAGPRDIRSGLLGIMLRLIAWISLIIGPIALLVFFQLQFLPYHDGGDFVVAAHRRCSRRAAVMGVVAVYRTRHERLAAPVRFPPPCHPGSAAAEHPAGMAGLHRRDLSRRMAARADSRCRVIRMDPAQAAGSRARIDDV